MPTSFPSLLALTTMLLFACTTSFGIQASNDQSRHSVLDNSVRVAQVPSYNFGDAPPIQQRVQTQLPPQNTFGGTLPQYHYATEHGVDYASPPVPTSGSQTPPAFGTQRITPNQPFSTQDPFEKQPFSNSQTGVESGNPIGPVTGQQPQPAMNANRATSSQSDSKEQAPNVKAKSLNAPHRSVVKPAATDSIKTSFSLSPQITIKHIGNANDPQVGTTFIITNEGRAPAQDVQIDISVQPEANIQKTNPSAAMISPQRARFRVGDLGIGNSKVLQVMAIHQNQQPVNFKTRIAMATTQNFEIAGQTPATEEKLNSDSIFAAPILSVENDPSVTAGQTIQFSVTLKNQTQKAMANLDLAVMPNDKVAMPANSPSKITIPELLPGQVLNYQLSMLATKKGECEIKFRVATQPEYTEPPRVEEISVPVTVQAKELEVAIEGPQRQYVGSLSENAVRIKNSDESELKDLTVKLKLPIGVQVVTLDRQAEFNAGTQELIWKVPSIKPGYSQIIRYKTKALTAGDSIQKAIVTSSDISGTAERSISIFGDNDVALKISTETDRIGANTSSTTTVVVENRDPSLHKSVELNVKLPPNSQIVESDVYKSIVGNVVIFKPFVVESGKNREFQIELTCQSPGTHPILAFAGINDSESPLIAQTAVTVVGSEAKSATKPESKPRTAMFLKDVPLKR